MQMVFILWLLGAGQAEPIGSYVDIHVCQAARMKVATAWEKSQAPKPQDMRLSCIATVIPGEERQSLET